MPLAKSAEQAKEQKPITEHPQAEQVFTYEGIPVDLYGFFYSSAENTSPKDKDKLRDLYEFAKESGKEIGSVLRTLSKLEGKLGLAGYDKRIDRLWNYIRLRRKTKDLSKQIKSMEK